MVLHICLGIINSDPVRLHGPLQRDGAVTYFGLTAMMALNKAYNGMCAGSCHDIRGSAGEYVDEWSIFSQAVLPSVTMFQSLMVNYTVTQYSLSFFDCPRCKMWIPQIPVKIGHVYVLCCSLDGVNSLT